MNCYSRKLNLVIYAFLLLAPMALFAQYKGEPVQRDRLVDGLRSKRFQTSDIVQIINENGVDFKLSPATENQLAAAGARPAVLYAVRRNYRGDKSTAKGGKGTGAASHATDYNSLVNDAVAMYDIQKNKQDAMSLLQRAVALQPGNPRAYQLMGFLSLYGNHDFNEAETYWKKSISLGGNAVLRVIHDHDGGFLTSCQGSLYISKNVLLFESDNNGHTFETTDRNIKKIEVNNKWKRLVQLRGGSFKILLNKSDNETNYNFAPLSGKTDESKMIIRLIGK